MLSISIIHVYIFTIMYIIMDFIIYVHLILYIKSTYVRIHIYTCSEIYFKLFCTDFTAGVFKESFPSLSKFRNLRPMVSTFTRIYIYTYVYVYIHIYIYIYIHIYVCMYICINKFIYMYTYTYMYMYT
jgi:hypothetical protein